MITIDKNYLTEAASFNDIIKILPHRYPFMFVDKISYLNEDTREIIGIKNVTINEHYFAGHFPDKPVMPGVLILEFLAQVAVILGNKINKENNNDPQVLLRSIDKAKFKKMVLPGDVLEGHVVCKNVRKNFYSFYGQAVVRNQVVAECSFSALLVC